MKVAIFHVTATLKVGGSETYVWRLARHLTDRNHTCHLWAGATAQPITGDPAVSVRTAAFTPRHRVWKLGGRFRKMMERVSFGWNARRQLTGECYEVFNIHKPYDIPMALWLKRRTGCRVVWRCHGTDFYPGLGTLLRGVDTIYCVSEFARKNLTTTYPVNASVIHTGVDHEFYCQTEQSTDAPCAPRILYFGRLEGWKGVNYLVESLVRLKSLDWSAQIVGDGPKRESLENQIRSAGMEDRIRLQPSVKIRSGVRDLLNRSDIVVFPSVADETFSNAVLEAMSMSRALIATNVGGFPEAVIEGQSGLLVPPSDSGALADAIKQLITHAALRNRLGEEARRRVVSCFPAKSSFEKVERLLANAGSALDLRQSDDGNVAKPR